MDACDGFSLRRISVSVGTTVCVSGCERVWWSVDWAIFTWCVAREELWEDAFYVLVLGCFVKCELVWRFGGSVLSADLHVTANAFKNNNNNNNNIHSKVIYRLVNLKINEYIF